MAMRKVVTAIIDRLRSLASAAKESGETSELLSWLTDLEIFAIIYSTEVVKYELLLFWRIVIDARSGATHQLAVEAYSRSLERYAKAAPSKNDLVSGLLLIAEFSFDLGHYSAAEMFYRESEKITSKMLKSQKSHPRSFTLISCARVALGLGKVMLAQGRYDDAEAAHRRSLQLREQAHGVDHVANTDALEEIGRVKQKQGDYETALEWYEKALELRRQTHGNGHEKVAAAIHNVGNVYYETRRLKEAREMFEEAYEMRVSVFGRSNPNPLIAASLNNIALVLTDEKDYEGAREKFLESLEMKLGLYGDSHPDVARAYHNVGNVEYHQKKFEPALESFRRGLEIRQTALGPDHPDVAISLQAIGLVYCDQGNYEEAEALCHDALKIKERAFGRSPKVAHSLRYLEIVYRKQGKDDEAEAVYSRIRDIMSGRITPPGDGGVSTPKVPGSSRKGYVGSNGTSSQPRTMASIATSP